MVKVLDIPAFLKLPRTFFIYNIDAMSIDFPKEEVATIERWRAINAFHRQVREEIAL